MAPKIADRVCETSITSGTGALTLAGAKPGYRSFSSAFTDGDSVYYCIADSSNWETGIGTFNTAGPTLTRTQVLSSSNANAAVSWGSSARDVFCTAPAQFLTDIQDDILTMSIIFGE